MEIQQFKELEIFKNFESTFKETSCDSVSGERAYMTELEIPVINFDKVKKDIKVKLNGNGYWYGREWPYKDIKPRIIAEKYMVDESGTELKDYKIMCFNGKADSIMFCYNRHNGDTRFKFFDLYEISGKIYFGEITLHNASGLDKDITLEADYLLGEKLKLPL